MADTKAADNKTNLMNYLASLITSEYSELADYATEMPSFPKAAQLPLSTIKEDFQYFKAGNRLARSQFEALSSNPDDIAKDASYFNRLSVNIWTFSVVLY